MGEKTACTHCNTEIHEYFDPLYAGKRGRCPQCEVDFPLE